MRCAVLRDCRAAWTVRWSLFCGAVPCQINGTPCNVATLVVTLTTIW
jgi:hypothetical protein